MGRFYIKSREVLRRSGCEPITKQLLAMIQLRWIGHDIWMEDSRLLKK